ncbi:MAG: SPOR domain-containing protein [Desulfobacterales bacterium]|nr:SPOR domain-containing protein [Desulfobacterales bacterium]
MNNGKQKAAGKSPPQNRNRRIAWGRYGAIVLIAAWMFGLGVLVGRGTAPVKFDIQKLTRELENLIAADVKKQLEPVELETAETKTKTELEFYEELKKSEPVAPDPPPRNTSRQPKENPPPDTVSREEDSPPPEQKVPAATTASKKSVTKPVGPSEGEKPRPANAAADRPLDNTGNVTIQAASLKDLAEADAMVKKLKNRGYPAYKTIAVVPGKGIWFRIRVGRYSSRESAGDVVGKLKKEGYRPILVEAN